MSSNNPKFNELLIEFHKKNYLEKLDEKKMISWSKEETVDFFRHNRMYQSIDPLLKSYPKSNWLTIGDGRYGTDAHYIQKHGLYSLATDISDVYLKKAKESGFISDYKLENVEKLSFNDDEFDFVLCKESYHHFARPMIGLYEMLRVAKKAVILIEPNDRNMLTHERTKLISAWLQFWRSFKYLVKTVMRKKKYCIYGEPDGISEYEIAGNYLFTISKREIEKVALGLNYEAVAFKGLNDYYEEGVEYEKFNKNSPLSAAVIRNINILDKLCKEGLKDYIILVAVIFKTKPTQDCLSDLAVNGFNVEILHKNPYIY